MGPAESGDQIAYFGIEADRVLVAGDPGTIAYELRDGDDLVYVADPIPNTQVNLGRDSDLAVICSMQEVSLFFDLGPGDMQPDALVFTRAVLAKLPGGYTRRILVLGVVEANDRIVLQLPPGETVHIEHGSTAEKLQVIVGSTVIVVLSTSGHLEKSIAAEPLA